MLGGINRHWKPRRRFHAFFCHAPICGCWNFDDHSYSTFNNKKMACNCSVFANYRRIFGDVGTSGVFG